MTCENCAYRFEEYPRYGGVVNTCLKSGKRLSFAFMRGVGCKEGKENKPRRLRKI